MELRVLGGVALLDGGGAEVESVLSHSKQTALLVYLAAAGRPVPRETLLGMFWPEADDKRARGSLKQAMYELRQALGAGLFAAHGDDEIAVDPSALRYDAQTFDAAVVAGELERAAELWQGSFLHGFYLKGCAEFEHWADGERERLNRAWIGVMEGLIDQAVERGDGDTAAHWARRLTRERPHSTRVALRVMEVLAAVGDRAGALQLADRYAALVRDEMGAEPSPAVQAYAARLRANPQAPTLAPPRPTAIGSERVLQLARIRAALGDRYVVEREVGAGGMATVYSAQDIKHERRVAVKVLRPELAAVIGAERFLQEIKLTARLQHPNILPLHDSGNVSTEGDNGHILYYVMPFVEGESLREKLNRDKQLGIDEAIQIADDVAAALDYAHRHQIIHRDIKPENILLHEGRAMVADFGIALAVTDAGGERLTETGLSPGTPEYMSPEQASNDKNIDARSDIYSLACVVYEMLVGNPPFSGVRSQVVLARKLYDSVPGIRTVRESVPQHCEQAILRALSRTPADRFSTVSRFLRAVRGPGQGRRLDGQAREPSSTGSTPDWRTATGSARWLHSVRRRYGKATVVAGAAVAGLAAYAIYRGVTPTSPSPVAIMPAITSPWREIGWYYQPEYPDDDARPDAHGWVFGSGDTLLMVQSRFDADVFAFDGDAWSVVETGDVRIAGRPFLDSGHVVVSGVFTEFDSSRGRSNADVQLYDITASGISANRRAAGQGARGTQWSDGDHLVNAVGGRIFRRDSAGWGEDPMGSFPVGIRGMWGTDDQHLIAIGQYPRRSIGTLATDMTDSILEYDGVSWMAKHTLPQHRGTLRLFEGSTYGPGGHAVVGTSCDQMVESCLQWIMIRDSASGSWVPRQVGVGRDFKLRRVSRLSSDELLVWGWTDSVQGSVRCGAAPCFFSIQGDEVQAVTDFGDTRAIGVGRVRGSTYLVMEDGSLWVLRSNQWAQLVQIPGTIIHTVESGPTGVTAVSDSRVFSTYRLRLTGDEPSRQDNSDVMVGVRKVVSRAGRVWLLTDSGAVFTCSIDHPRGAACPLRASESFRSVRLTDLEVGGGGEVVGLMTDGTLLTLPRTAATPMVVAEAQEDVFAWLVRDRAGRVFAVGAATSVYQDASGTWHRGTGSRRNVHDVTVTSGGGLVTSRVAYSNRWVVEINSPFRPLIAGLGPAPVVHALTDGRIVLGFSRPANPALGGWIEVVDPDMATSTGEIRSARVELPRAADVYDMTDDGENLFVVGSHRFSMSISLDSLPRGVPSRDNGLD